MQRRSFSAALAVLMLAPGLPALAAPTRVTASEIEALLAGNTIVGTWSGTAYRQYYDAGGNTVYVPEGGKPDEGQWRVNAGTNEYESWWRSTGWTPYAMVRTDDGAYAWINGDRLEPFQVLSGRQVE
ncbi:MAG: hypothetical protein COW54_03430 [Rhodobacteraceae bacterium CG17_big_fil_post_rev_8_21_14_2_50_63_15]|nr:hypothetical protein [Roseovarius sp.]PIV79575.1 MAG: hypothetical protein COW54_03430 [Rhodobacteraceae bacterium CG17_big_fil_post_rev_8_21_14_2_50_63_15]